MVRWKPRIMANLNRVRQMELINYGWIDIYIYRYRLLSDGQIQRLPRKCLGTLAERGEWQDVGYLSV